MLQDESEDYVAHMWRRVALCSKDPVEQLQAYQYAIEALSVRTFWVKGVGGIVERSGNSYFQNNTKAR